METLERTKDTRVGRYLLKGDPVAMCIKHRYGDGRVWDLQKINKVTTCITLDSQHNEAPFFQGPISLNISFYLPITSVKRLIFDNKPHTQDPDLDNLIRYVTEVGIGILYKDDGLISSITACKYYSTDPRTEIIIRQCHEDIW